MGGGALGPSSLDLSLTHAQIVRMTGIQTATDIASTYPGEKEITLVHSRTRLINAYAEGVHEEGAQISRLAALDLR